MACTSKQVVIVVYELTNIGTARLPRAHPKKVDWTVMAPAIARSFSTAKQREGSSVKPVNMIPTPGPSAMLETMANPKLRYCTDANRSQAAATVLVTPRQDTNQL
mmetsp:Transcript_88319/g.152694  ORF Transcript_88319/g.152694 Transcript_88319/m.152694 type:complete len:105 (-) Transcript_88319:256-570(-)